MVHFSHFSSSKGVILGVLEYISIFLYFGNSYEYNIFFNRKIPKKSL